MASQVLTGGSTVQKTTTSSIQNQQSIAGTGPRSIGSEVPGVCSLLVEFRGTGFGEQTNGPGFTSVGGGPHFGLGFTVSGSVTEGGIGVFETRTVPQTGKPYQDVVNPNGTWTVQQWASLSGSSTYDDTYVPWPVNIQNKPDAAKKEFRKVEGNEFVYGDYPGPVTLSLDGYHLVSSRERYDFDIKVIRGSQQCEVRFWVNMQYKNGRFTAFWHRGQ